MFSSRQLIIKLLVPKERSFKKTQIRRNWKNISMQIAQPWR